MSRILATASLALLVACQSVPAPSNNPRQTWCDSNAPQQYSPAVIDAMSRTEIDRMNAFNDRGIAWCGWKA